MYLKRFLARVDQDNEVFQIIKVKQFKKILQS